MNQKQTSADEEKEATDIAISHGATAKRNFTFVLRFGKRRTS